MKPAEARKLREAVRFNCRLSASDTWTLKVLINSMTEDTDPRLEMLDELECSYKLDPNCVIETIDYFRDKIKQEAGNE
jgi:hypothetical protein